MRQDRLNFGGFLVLISLILIGLKIFGIIEIGWLVALGPVFLISLWAMFNGFVNRS